MEFIFIIDCRDEDACVINQFVQAGIADITKIVILKKLLYGTSEALKRAAQAADEDTEEHVVRINRYAEELARQKGLLFVNTDLVKSSRLSDVFLDKYHQEHKI